MKNAMRHSGIGPLGDVPWGSHFCQFYRDRQDLIDILVPYFKAGLENNEFCVWVTCDPLTPGDAREAMAREVPALDRYMAGGQFEVMPHTDWYTRGGSFDMDRALREWLEKLSGALRAEFDGMRVSGNTAWLEKADWASFTEYEAAINNIGPHNLIVLCTYCLDRCSALEMMDVVRNHEFALLKQGGKWELVENSVNARTREALRRAEERYRSIVEASADGIWLTDVRGNTTFVNDTTARLLGYTPEEMIGLPTSLFVPADEKQDSDSRLKEPSAKGKARYERLLRRRDGSEVCVIVSGNSITDAQGNVVQTVSMLTDITERKQAEDALLQRESELSTIFSNIPMLMLVVDPERTVRKANSAAAQFTGRGAEQMLGMRAGEALCCLHSDDDPKGCGFGPFCQDCQMRLAIADTLEHRNNHCQLEWSRTLARGDVEEDKTFLISTISLPTATDQVLVCIEDITERKQAENSLRQRTRELEAANKELEAFSYSVSHDLRAPLRSIEGFSQALLEDYYSKLDSQGQDFLGRIQQSSRLMAQLMDDLLRLSRVTRAEMRREEVDLSSLAASITESLRKAEPDRSVQVVVSPGMTARGDKNLLLILLENLLGNAWKFTTKTGSPRIEVGMAMHGDGAAFMVRDNGAGFDMQYAGKLFMPFQRLHKASDFPGSGIGLATVQRIVRRHGGNVWAESSPGHGAAFYFTLS